MLTTFPQSGPREGGGFTLSHPTQTIMTAKWNSLTVNKVSRGIDVSSGGIHEGTHAHQTESAWVNS
ncbi:hypothetical protein [Candidatus Villigracilis saccharophilus]|uniref:hypothetical protein n=1 Tax=Candidatus Villigracilis saccharophilus TaxID=3140684 RepID=UPI003136E613|nr:hypothetical protein [Anaerolineales bacterium]